MNASKEGEIYFKEQIIKIRWSNVPEHARPADPLYKYRRKRGAIKIESMICDFLLLEGDFGERTKTIRRGFYSAVQTKGIWIPGTGTVGSSDIKAVINGNFVAIEVKYGNDKQSPKQALYEDAIKRSGGLYWIVKDFEDFYKQYTNFKNTVY